MAGVPTPEQPAVPECGEHVWAWWWELNTRRQPGFDSLSPISYAEIHAWIMLTGKHVAPEEVGWLIAMDNAWLHAISQERAARREREADEAERKKQQGGKHGRRR